ncbi:hypothetical protein [Paenibacillus sp. JZ16]|uniref:hypothetical protein n=1 Tax=Paenibacillus sp. JZ16 TaxID=1906272 RepID=UPI001889EA9C|nr:hypothetical protein [Paenibacillus sp. JZ16]
MNKNTFQDLLPETLYESIKTKSCGFFVGAGVSSLKPTNLPSWRNLLIQFLEYAKSNQKLEEQTL